ncbi:hypothetical protein ACIA8E_18125 [Streptomyces sp. NPDC051664]|uniref:hypothetical protein n=1 Tax=Streptomyces sp. NPDC051664 TaxID=3365668 RepID=UPI0037B90053
MHLGTEAGSRTTSASRTATTSTATTRAAKDDPGTTECDPPDTAIGGGSPCDVVTVPARQGLEAVDILRRGADQEAVGPVLHDGTCDTLGFLVPPGTAEAWDVPGSACTKTNGRGVRIPAEPPVSGSGWLLPDAADARVTDPAALRAALDQAARLIEAADNCR